MPFIVMLHVYRTTSKRWVLKFPASKTGAENIDDEPQSGHLFLCLMKGFERKWTNLFKVTVCGAITYHRPAGRIEEVVGRIIPQVSYSKLCS